MVKPTAKSTVAQMKQYIRDNKLNKAPILLGMKRAELITHLRKMGHYDSQHDKPSAKVPAPKAVPKPAPKRKVLKKAQGVGGEGSGVMPNPPLPKKKVAKKLSVAEATKQLGGDLPKETYSSSKSSFMNLTGIWGKGRYSGGELAKLIDSKGFLLSKAQEGKLKDVGTAYGGASWRVETMKDGVVRMVPSFEGNAMWTPQDGEKSFVIKNADYVKNEKGEYTTVDRKQAVEKLVLKPKKAPTADSKETDRQAIQKKLDIAETSIALIMKQKKEFTASIARADKEHFKKGGGYGAVMKARDKTGETEKLKSFDVKLNERRKERTSLKSLLKKSK
jgi:hypothetical protein